jgi:hypothetical protein
MTKKKGMESMQSMNANSLDALDRSKLGYRMRLIHACLLRHGPQTDRQVKALLNLPDMNCVRPRINELIDLHYARVVNNVRCPITGQTVRVTEALARAVQKDLDL